MELEVLNFEIILDDRGKELVRMLFAETWSLTPCVKI